MEKKQKINLLLKNLMINFFFCSCFLIFYNCREQNKTITNDKFIINTKANQGKKTVLTVAKTIENKKTNQETIPKTKVLGYFDYDDSKDTIYYYLDKTKGEPLYNCEIYFGNKKIKKISISTASGYIQLTNCEKGCIQKSEITTGIYSSEEIEKYQYDNKLEKWFITESISKLKGDTTINNNFEEPWSIDD